MNKMILAELVKEVKKLVGGECDVMSYQLRKNNGVTLQAIGCKRKGASLATSVHVDQLMEAMSENEMTVTEAAKKVIETAEAARGQECCINTSVLTDRNFILSHVKYQMINRELNQEQLDGLPHRDVLDLSAIYRVIVYSDASHTASYMLNNAMIEQVGINMEELDKAADYNTQKDGFEVRTMAEIIAEIVRMHGESMCKEYEGPQVYILTNARKANGANVLLYNSVLGNLADKVGDDLYILPSSIHECIAVPVLQMKPDSLVAMVGEVNRTVVANEEILSYRVYKYSRAMGQLSIA